MRPQSPGNQSHLRAFLERPPAIHSRESPAPLALPQSFGKLRKLSRFAEPTLRQIVAPRNTKKSSPCEEPVDDVSSLWKPEENWRRIAGVSHFYPSSRSFCGRG